MFRNKSIDYYLISPIFGLISAFSNLKSPISRIALFGFCLSFGICFSVGTKRIQGSSDGITMRIEFDKNCNLTESQYIKYLSDYFEFNKGAQDIYIVTVAFLVGRITDNYHFFFLTLAIVFAFFQLKCLKYFVKEPNYKNSLACIILACLFLWNNIYNINGARFWTASWIGIYTVFKVFYDKNIKYFLLACCLFMIHAAFAVFPVIMLLAYFIKFRGKSLLIIFGISFLVAFTSENLDLQFLNKLYLPFAIAKKVEFYTDSDYINSLSQGTGFYWVRLLFKSLVRIYINVLVLLIILNGKNLIDIRGRDIVHFMVVLAIIANFGMIIPTFGGRLFVVNYALVSYSFLSVFGDKKYKILIYMMPLVWFMNIFYLFKDVYEVLDLWFIFSPIISFGRYLIG